MNIAQLIVWPREGKAEQVPSQHLMTHLLIFQHTQNVSIVRIAVCMMVANSPNLKQKESCKFTSMN